MDRQGKPTLEWNTAFTLVEQEDLRDQEEETQQQKDLQLRDLRGVKCTYPNVVSQAEIYVPSSSMSCFQHRLMILIF